MGKLLGIAKRKASRAPMEALDEAEITTEAGVQDDFRGKPGKRQVTVITTESWENTCAQLGFEIPWTTRRANLIIKGEPLSDSVGSFLHIGEAVLEITGENPPCARMDEAHEGLQEALVTEWRGGVCCRVIKGGMVKIGSPVKKSSSPSAESN